MKSTTYIHPNLILFWNSLAYPKLLLKLGLATLIIILIPTYIFSRPEMFVEHNATITGIEFRRGINMRQSDSLDIEYRYTYENKLYDKSGSHFLPKGYPEESWRIYFKVETNASYWF